MKRKQISGFTLIEIMIVVVIIGILAAVAYPSYQKYARETRRADAKSYLLEAAAQQEKFFAECSWYGGTITGSRACGDDKDNGILGISDAAPGGDYTISVTEGNINGACTAAGSLGALYTCGFTLTATPKTTSPQSGDGPLRIDATGVREWNKNGAGTWLSWSAK